MNQLLSYIDIIYIPKKYHIRAKNKSSIDDLFLYGYCHSIPPSGAVDVSHFASTIAETTLSRAG